MEKKKYRVWFEQINADMIDVEAVTENEARILAKKEWIKYNYPEVTCIEEQLTEPKDNKLKD